MMAELRLVLRILQERVDPGSICAREAMARAAVQPGISDRASRFERVEVSFINVTSGQAMLSPSILLLRCWETCPLRASKRLPQACDRL